METSSKLSTAANAGAMSDGIDHLYSSVDRCVQDAKQLAVDAKQTLSQQVGDMRAETTNAISHAAQGAQDMVHRGVDSARDAVSHARDGVAELRDQTARRVQADPIKAILIAAAAGAATALLLQWVAHARHPR
jgi:ElaB/YqjD/DUF883 family membrane-anchored ribosome-binding protein